MTAALDIVIPVLAIASLVTAVIFVFRAWRFRSLSARATFGVAQHEARQAMHVDIVRSIAAAFVGLILLGTIGLSPSPPSPVESQPEPTQTQTRVITTTPAELPTIAAPALATDLPAIQGSATVAATSTSSPATATPTPSATFTPIPTETPRAEPITATVSSGVGVWLRNTPSTEGEQLEWVLDGTVLILLPGKATADELEWQEVQTPGGNEGWVAAQYLIYGE